MKFWPVLHEKPPIIDLLLPVFGSINENTIFAFNGAIYSPGGKPISVALQAHEGVHLERQGGTETGARQWWEQYIESPRFRAVEELLAHRAEWECFKARHQSAKKREWYLGEISKRLAGPLYSVFTGVEALEAITQARRAITERAA